MEYFEFDPTTHFLPKRNAVVFMNTADFLSSEDVVAKKVTFQKKEYEVVSWGDADEAVSMNK